MVDRNYTTAGPRLLTKPKFQSETDVSSMLPFFDNATFDGVDNPVKKFDLDYGNNTSLASCFSTTTLYDSAALEDRLFDATAAVKILTSQVAMHVGRKWRDKLFQQIDALHDIDEWYEEDMPIDKNAFSSFIKGILFINPSCYPGIGLSHQGHVLAAWVKGRNRLILEFLPGDRVKWIVSKLLEDGEMERATGDTSVSRLHLCLAPYSPESWLNCSES